MKPVSILLSALFEALTAESLGLLTLFWLRPRFTRQEQYVYGFIVGSAALSLFVFLTGATHLMYTPVYLAIGGLAMGVCFWTRAWRPYASSFPPLPRFYVVLLWASLLVYGIFSGANALAPEVSPDGSAYHLGLTQRFLSQHSFGWITTSMYANMPLGIEMIFLFAFSLGRHSAAALVHFWFLLAIPFVIVTFARRVGYPRAGVAAGLFVFISPVFLFDGSSAYVDVALACIAFTLFAFLQIWDETRESVLLPLIGLIAGFCYAAKMTGFVAIPYAVLFVLYKLLRARKPWLRPVLIVFACILVMMGPWMLKNYVTVGNPVSPFANRVFPNPGVRISFEDDYRKYHKNFDEVKNKWLLPLEVTIRGGPTAGLLGAVFLLAPFGLLSMRWKLGRQVMLAALIFGSTYPNNLGTRFLMPAAAFLAFGIALQLAHWRGMAPLVICFHVFASWPYIMRTYVDEYAWRLDHFYWEGALRKVPEAQYIQQRNSAYAAAVQAERNVPKDGRIFTFGGIPQAYCRREVIVAYESALGNTLGEVVLGGYTAIVQPTNRWLYRFPKGDFERIRLVQTGNSNSPWNIAEVRLLGVGGEVERGKQWRLRARPNPWDVQYAFDNCPTTRWFAAEPSRPGFFVEIDLGKPTELVAVQAECAPDQPEGSARVEGWKGGEWKVLAEKPVVSMGPPIPRARRLAMDDLKRHGVTHFSVNKNEFCYKEIVENAEKWGLTLLGDTGEDRLYRID